jgi:hypothetical protein
MECKPAQGQWQKAGANVRDQDLDSFRKDGLSLKKQIVALKVPTCFFNWIGAWG